MIKKNETIAVSLIFCIISMLATAALFAQQEEADPAKLKEMNKALEIKLKEFDVKNKDYEQKKKEVDDLTKLVDKLNEERLKYKKDKEGLEEELVQIKDNFNAERSTLYAELGDNYTKSKLFSQAIDAYNKALKLDPGNAEVHYNIALLYKYSLGDVDRAVEHLQYYLKLAPDPKHRKDAEYLLGVLRADRMSPYE